MIRRRNIHTLENETNNRFLIVKIFFILLFLIVGGRLFYIQVIKGGYYKSVANDIYTHKVVIYARRGNIKDRLGRIIVTSRKTLSLGIEPVLVRNKNKLLRYMKKWKCNMEDVDIALKTHRFRWVKDDIDKKLKKEIFEVNIPGTYLKERYKRIYPENMVGWNLLGLEKDGKGRSGIEYMYDNYLKGENGWEEKHKRPWGSTTVYPGFDRKDPIDGKDIYLTIDWDIQSICDKLLKEWVEKSGAKKGMIIVVNPNNGELLAVSNYPVVDSFGYRLPNYAFEFSYEPGSVIKPLILSYLFSDKGFSLSENDTLVDSTGVMEISGHLIKDHDKHGILTLEEALIHSSNVGFAKLSLMAGRKKIYAALKEFGIGMKTFLDYKGEANGIVRRYDKWREIDLATIGYGYGFSTTLIQLVMAYSAIANGGYLYEPMLLKKVEGKSETRPKPIRRVISSVSAERVRNIMEKVVEEGTGTNAKIDGLAICGKTGTAHKAKENGKGYTNKYIASFIGMFPKDNPQFVIGISLDEPSYSYRFGGSSAAPLFKAIAQRIIEIDRYRYITEEKENEKID